MGFLNPLFVLVISFALGVGCSQHRLVVPDSSVACAEQHKTWDSPPHPDDTCHIIFDSVGNLLQHWSNTQYPNGHTVVPTVIKPGTLLFHGRSDDQTPPGPEWLAFDSEFSLFYTESGDRPSLLTYAATRELRILYFDGMSGAKRPWGTIDAQDIVSYGHVTQKWDMESELRRIIDLCNWGKPYRLDGFLRMNFNFEIMYCNFTDGLELVSRVPVLTLAPGKGYVPGTERRPSTPPKGWKGSLRDEISIIFELLQSGSWHNFFPIPGIRVDYSRLLTFYNLKYESLIDSRTTVVYRSKHRLLNISQDDAQTFRSELHEALTRSSEERGGGIDWGELIRHITERHAGRIDFLRYLLRSVGAKNASHPLTPALNTSAIIWDVRLQGLTMLSPYLARTSVPSSDDRDPVSNKTWLAPAMEDCSSTYTSHLDTTLFTPQEHILKSSVDETVGQICRTLGLIWLTAFNAESISSEDERMSLLLTWKEELDRLTDWLGWAQWIKCEPTCADDQLCILPSLIFRGTKPFCIPRLHWILEPNDTRFDDTLLVTPFLL